MRYGFHMSTRGATAIPTAIRDVAQNCERLGFDYFGVNDHVIVCQSIESPYPYSADGSWAGAAEGICLETLTTLGFIAAHTERMRLLTSVMVIPHRPAVLTAKMLATVDVLSGGRLTVGVGVGWMREEMAALQSPAYEQRGRASDEYIEAYRALWQGEVCEYHGEHVDFSGVIAEPKPVQRPAPPIWIGGEGPAARRRVARHGDGWYPVGRNPRHPLDTLERFSAGVEDVRRRVEAAGRDPASIEVALYAPWARLGKEQHEDGTRVAFTGSAQAMAEDIARFEQAGLNLFIANLEGRSVNETLDRCNAFAAAMALRAA
ncbi:MAG: LLM class F420-dependent oxidoreductase [Gammaproteobacteria bacterium]|nr:LLM class F420-dependent oxidoreductase [Gammaproteobacteria bacterium]